MVFKSIKEKMSSWRKKSGDTAKATLIIILLFLTIEFIFLLFPMIQGYATVYPGSKVAQNLSGGKGTAFAFFQWLICGVSVTITGTLAFQLATKGLEYVNKEIGLAVAWLIALPWIAICIFLGTWQLWIYWVIVSVW